LAEGSRGEKKKEGLQKTTEVYDNKPAGARRGKNLRETTVYTEGAETAV